MADLLRPLPMRFRCAPRHSALLPVVALLLAGCSLLPTLPGRNPLFSPGPVEKRGDTAIYRGYYPNGGLLSVITLVDGKPEGMSYHYHPNGAVKGKVPWRAGQREGEAESFHANGKPASVRRYIRDTLQAEAQADFDSSGNRTSVWLAGDGPGTGSYLITRGGKVIDSTYYRNNREEGYSFSLGSQGDTTSRTFYRDGKQDTSVLKWSPKPGTYRSTEDILKVIRKHTPGLRYSYNSHLARGKFNGKVTLTFAISPEGHIASIYPRGDTSGRPRFVQDILKKVNLWRFTAVKSTADDIVTVPFTFSL